MNTISIGKLLIALALTSLCARGVDQSVAAPQASEADAGQEPQATAADATCASAQFLAVDLVARTPRLPVGGGTARFTATVRTRVGLEAAWVDIRVPAGVRKPAGYPKSVALVPGVDFEHSFELALPGGSARHDIVAGLRAVQGGVDIAQYNNAWVAIGDAVEPRPLLSRSGASLVREVRFGDPLRRDGR